MNLMLLTQVANLIVLSRYASRHCLFFVFAFAAISPNSSKTIMLVGFEVFSAPQAVSGAEGGLRSDFRN